VRYKEAVIFYSKALSLYFYRTAEENLIEPKKYTNSGPEKENGTYRIQNKLVILMFNPLTPNNF
jgi:hypothetical protein